MKNYAKLSIVLFLLITLLSTSCSDVLCITGTLKLTNRSFNPYKVYVDGVYEMKVSGRTSRDLNLTEGAYDVRVEQESGYLLFPTVLEKTISVDPCSESEWKFPL
jgi:hypothetical protein